MNINYNQILKILNPFIIALLFAYIFAQIVYFYLPKYSSVNKTAKIQSLDYYRFANFYVEKSKSNKVQELVKTNDLFNLNLNILLKAIYSTKDFKGWILIEEKNSKKSHALGFNEEFKGYKLVKLFDKYVVFEKFNKEYKLELPKEKELKIISSVKSDDEVLKVNKNEVLNYTKDINKIWQNIAIDEQRTNGFISGFKINRINKNSVFGKLGLKKGDIIKSVNGKEIKNYNDAFKIYNGIKSMNYLVIGVLRDNQIMELEYEIN